MLCAQCAPHPVEHPCELCCSNNSLRKCICSDRCSRDMQVVVDGNTPQTIFDTLRSRLREHVESNPQVGGVLHVELHPQPAACSLSSSIA
jgi:hypothetical protein